MKTNATVLRRKKRFKIVFLPNFSTAGQTTVNKKAPIHYIIPINDPPPKKKKKSSHSRKSQHREFWARSACAWSYTSSSVQRKVQRSTKATDSELAYGDHVPERSRRSTRGLLTVYNGHKRQVATTVDFVCSAQNCNCWAPRFMVAVNTLLLHHHLHHRHHYRRY